MNGNDGKVLLGLNYPAFQRELFDLDALEIKNSIKTFRKIKGFTWNEVFRDQGLKWEELKNVSGKYTVRLSRSCRAVVVREGCWMRFQTLHRGHE